MAPRILICIVASSALIGCHPVRPDVVAQAPIWQPCTTTGGSSSNPAKCTVDIPVTGSCPGANIDFDKLDLALNGSGSTMIIWKLPQGYQFCPAQGDGAFLKFFDDTEQFGDPAATDDDNGAMELTATKCKKNFRLRDDNTQGTAGKTYKYRLQFTDKRNKTTCTTDPQIRNG